jgi:polar amino acid transport system substrate-binding protein
MRTPLGHVALAAAVLAIPLVLACGLPRDSAGTLERVRHGTMRVGVTTDTPWVTDSAGVLDGVEPALVRTIAASVGARVLWVRRPAAELMTSLQTRQLDLVVGGHTSAEPWKKQVAFTRPFYTDTVMTGAPGPAPSRASLAGMEIAVERGDPVAESIRKRRAVPVPVSTLDSATGLVAAPTWRLAAMGRTPTGPILLRQPHVLALPPGENAWLVHVELLLHAREPVVATMLRRAR